MCLFWVYVVIGYVHGGELKMVSNQHIHREHENSLNDTPASICWEGFESHDLNKHVCIMCMWRMLFGWLWSTDQPLTLTHLAAPYIFMGHFGTAFTCDNQILLRPYDLSNIYLGTGLHWFKQKSLSLSAPNHYMNQCWLIGRNKLIVISKIVSKTQHCLQNIRHSV